MGLKVFIAISNIFFGFEEGCYRVFFCAFIKVSDSNHFLKFIILVIILIKTIIIIIIVIILTKKIKYDE